MDEIKKVMEDHKCVKEKQFGELETTVDRISRVVEGNGHEGLAITSIRLEETVKGLYRLVEEIKVGMGALRTTISGFEKFQVEYTAMKVTETKYDLNRRWMVRTIIALGSFLVAAAGLLIRELTK